MNSRIITGIGNDHLEMIKFLRIFHSCKIITFQVTIDMCFHPIQLKQYKEASISFSFSLPTTFTESFNLYWDLVFDNHIFWLENGCPRCCRCGYRGRRCGRCDCDRAWRSGHWAAVPGTHAHCKIT